MTEIECIDCGLSDKVLPCCPLTNYLEFFILMKIIKANLLALAAAISLSLAGSTVYADQVLNDGLWVGGKLGVASLQSPDQGLLNASDTSERKINPAFGGTMGYLYFDTNSIFTAVQLGADFYENTAYKGSFNGDSTKANISQYDFDMLFDVGFAAHNGFNLIGKLGMARVTQTFSDRNNNSSVSLTGNDRLTRYQPKAELDMGYIIDSNTDLVLAYSRIFGNSDKNFPVDNNKILTNNALMLSLNYILP